MAPPPGRRILGSHPLRTAWCSCPPATSPIIMVCHSCNNLGLEMGPEVGLTSPIVWNRRFIPRVVFDLNITLPCVSPCYHTDNCYSLTGQRHMDNNCGAHVSVDTVCGCDISSDRSACLAGTVLQLMRPRHYMSSFRVAIVSATLAPMCRAVVYPVS